jgi:hypothetical protein
MLSLWDGKEASRVRMKDGFERVKNPQLSLLGNVPPAQLGRVSSRREEGDGFLPRLLWNYTEPRDPSDEVNFDPVPPGTVKGWADALGWLYRQTDPRTLVLSPGARERYEKRLKKHNRLVKAVKGDETLHSTWAKLRVYAARLLVVLHALHEYARTGGDAAMGVEVTPEVVDGAWDLVAYYLASARKVLGLMAETAEVRQAKKLLEVIRAKGWETFTKRELYQSVRGRAEFSRSHMLDVPLDTLVEWGEIEPVKGAADGRPGRPSETYRLLPSPASSKSSKPPSEAKPS